MTIIFYDIPSTLPGNAWSPNTWKTRYTLNYKGIPYVTQWVEYPDVEALSKKLGMKPTSKKTNGSDHYTLPAIHDPSTGIYLSDSALIAEYLETQYPTTPPLFKFPNGNGIDTRALQHAFAFAYSQVLEPLWAFILTPSCLALNPPSQDYFRRTREADFGVTMEELVPKGDAAVKEWSKLQTNLDRLDAWYAKTDARGPFLMGGEVSWGDVVVASYIIWLRIVWGEEDQKWKDILGWQGGRWGKLLKELEKYTAIN